MTYLIVLIYLQGILSFLIYTSVGMISYPIACLLNSSNHSNQFTSSEPVVQYVIVYYFSFLLYFQNETPEADEPEEFISDVR